MTSRLVLLVLLINIVLINADSRFCYSQETCGKCLDHDQDCAWCSDTEYNMKRSRCMTQKDLKDAKCREKYIETNKYEDVKITKDDELRDFNKDFDSVQIKPQNVKMKLRKNRQQRITMKYKPAKNYPLDLYYLMDLSWTMKDDKQTLVGMGGSLTKSLSNLTENFRLGFGSFADKPIMPFINPGSEKNPCDLVHDVCLPTYGFKHKLALTDDIQQFISRVNSSEITANLDNLEGGLDALMQILVCRDEIGWNDKTRKMVVFATDGPMHFAGDGLLAGLVKKNDKSCHLNDQGDYMASLEFDYPSLEEIYRELLKTKITVIFAVTSKVIHHYDQIHELMEDITSVEQLAVDSSNIIQLVQKGYAEATKRAQFQDNAPSYVKVEYRTTCGRNNESPQETSKCDNIEIGNEYLFDLDVTLLDYPEDGTKNLKIKIEEANIDSEALEIDVEIDYPCATCSSLPGVPAAELCSFNGELQCGSCACDKGWVGKQCECSLQEYSSTKELDNQCREVILDENNSTHLGAMCFERGECLCGQCYCNWPFEGRYCECDPCPVFNERVCGGNGVCNCGECKCKPEFSGRTCECSSLQANCIAPNIENSEASKVCSGHGTCKCNQCDCDTGHFGNFCESSPGNETLNSLCIFYEPCVQCVINRKLERECSDFQDKCSSKSGILYKSEFYDDISDAKIQCIARVRYDDDTVCEYKFTYDQENGDTNLSIADAKCPPVNVAAYSIIGIIIATFLLGLIIMMVIRVNIYYADKREFAKFEEERLQTEYKYESPIYKSPVTTFLNPTQQANRDSKNAFELQ